MKNPERSADSQVSKPIRVGLLGSGHFVRAIHVDNLTRHPGFIVHGVADPNLDSAKEVADLLDGALAMDDPYSMINDPKVEMVLIATPHHTHASLAIAAADAGKHVLCEKPMGLTAEECREVCRAVENNGVHYLANYNRAVAPFTQQIREKLTELKAPMMMHYRWANWNPYSSGWLLEESLSGGRIIGEAGHALDTMCRLAGADPVRLYAEGGNFAEPNSTKAPDSALITLGFPDGSSGTLYLSSIANNAYPKEELLISCAGTTFQIKAYQEMTVFSPKGVDKIQLPEPDRGLYAMLQAAYASIREGAPIPTGIREASRTSHLTFAAVRSIRERTLQHF